MHERRRSSRAGKFYSVMVRPPYAMSVPRKAGMLLIRGALATQVWIYRRTKGRRAGPGLCR